MEKPQYDRPPVMPEHRKMMKKIFYGDMQDVSAGEYDKFALDRNRDKFVQEFVKLLKTKLDPVKQYKMLEMGMGTGISTEELKKMENVEVFGLDRSEEYIKYAIEKGRVDEDHVAVGDFNGIPFQDETFDIYTGVAILILRKDIKAFYAEALRVLKKDGLIIFPWIRPKKTADDTSFIEKEKIHFEENNVELVEEGEWYLIGKKK
jgi:ubiquinone/menaquinone biosynthesis C-methylase UbiE